MHVKPLYMCMYTCICYVHLVMSMSRLPVSMPMSVVPIASGSLEVLDVLGVLASAVGHAGADSVAQGHEYEASEEGVWGRHGVMS